MFFYNSGFFPILQWWFFSNLALVVFFHSGNFPSGFFPSGFSQYDTVLQVSASRQSVLGMGSLGQEAKTLE